MGIKRYLNREEKDIALTLGGFSAYMTNTAEKWDKLGRPKTQLKYLRTAKTYVEKTIVEMFTGLDTEELARIVAESAKIEVTAQYKKDAVREYQAMLKLESVKPIDAEDLYDLVEHAIGICKTCRKEGPEIQACRIREIYVKYDIPGLYTALPVEYCVYQYRDYQKCKGCGEYFDPGKKGGHKEYCPSCQPTARESDLNKLQAHFSKRRA